MNSKTLPRGYRQVGVLDFMRSRRELKAVTVLSLAPCVLMLAWGLWRHPFGPTWALWKARPWTAAAALALQILYIPGHELVHGVCMRALSGVKPRYGLKLPYAYAGSTAFFDRRSHGVIALAPLLLWGVLLAVLERRVPEGWFWPLYLVQISNVSGSAGDIWCVWRLRQWPGDLRIQDSGTRMRVFAPRPATEGEER